MCFWKHTLTSTSPEYLELIICTFEMQKNCFRSLKSQLYLEQGLNNKITVLFQRIHRQHFIIATLQQTYKPNSLSLESAFQNIQGKKLSYLDTYLFSLFRKYRFASVVGDQTYERFSPLSQPDHSCTSQVSLYHSQTKFARDI